MLCSYSPPITLLYSLFFSHWSPSSLQILFLGANGYFSLLCVNHWLVSLEFVALLPLLPQHWDHSLVPPPPAMKEQFSPVSDTCY